MYENLFCHSDINLCLNIYIYISPTSAMFAGGKHVGEPRKSWHPLTGISEISREKLDTEK
ncbi:OB-fold nucleic acid binding domain protein [Methanosarcina siciliae HI350]|uniref:OB-fold nucleic acid binding domain protein n=1 Tax=Methanosarcina siciliae HI350 TaxID=1434119 RepID=A0A0E3PBX6_9EURY|nr:OB-fold nucleic acid binding domain protein [Methanosarcina siciliae HI350]